MESKSSTSALMRGVVLELAAMMALMGCCSAFGTFTESATLQVSYGSTCKRLLLFPGGGHLLFSTLFRLRKNSNRHYTRLVDTVVWRSVSLFSCLFLKRGHSVSTIANPAIANTLGSFSKLICLSQ